MSYEGGSAEVLNWKTPRHPNVFCGICAPQLVIRQKRVTLNRLFQRNKTIFTSGNGTGRHSS